MNLSIKAQNYLAKFKRVRHHNDEKVLALILENEGIRDPERIIEFQINYGGYVEHVGLNEYTFGIIHENPVYLEPNELELDEDENGIKLLAAADAHLSYGILIDELGRFYYNGRPNASNFHIKIERDAFFSMVSKKNELKAIKTIKIGLSAIQILNYYQENKIEDLSDEYAEFYYKSGSLLINRYGWKRNSKSNELIEDYFPELYISEKNIPEILRNIEFEFFY